MAVGLPGEEAVPIASEAAQRILAGSRGATGLNAADHVLTRDIDQSNVYKVDVDLWIAPDQTGDADTWDTANNRRKGDGYGWYCALQVSIGSNYGQDLAAFHIGLALAWGDPLTQPWRWHGSFGGYYGNDSSTPGAIYGTPYISNYFSNNTWYTLRMERTGQINSNTWRWRGYIINKETGVSVNMGYYDIVNGWMVSNAMYWNEIQEPWVTPTDFVGNHNLNCQYQRMLIGFPEAFYNGKIGYNNQNVINTDLRCIRTSDRYTISDRDCQRLHPQGATLWQY